jgi:restriction system protein
MALWMVRGGREGEREEMALEQNLLLIGWPELADLSRFGSREALLEHCLEVYTDQKKATVVNWVGQLWRFTAQMETEDLVCMPLKGRAAIAAGRIAGPYRYDPSKPPESRHTRPVKWLNTEVPRSAFGQDLLYSLGAIGTVCQISRNDAEARVEAILQTGKDPGLLVPPTKETGTGNGGEPDAPINLEEYALDLIVQHIGNRYKEHELARLVGAVLRAQGYLPQVSSPGPDGGVDIIAGQGPLGFDPPRLCVQVKSGGGTVDIKTYNEFYGAMHNFGAEQGLLVSWSGFKHTVHTEARKKYFRVRLWDANNLVSALLQNYERLPEDIQAELPLKRIWTLVVEEE